MAASELTSEEFASAHLDALLRFATALTNDRELGADLVQDVLLRAHERWAHVGSRTDPVPYVRRMIVNEFISWRRKWARVVPGVNLADEIGPTGAPDHAERYADHLNLLHELERLPRRQRAVIVLSATTRICRTTRSPRFLGARHPPCAATHSGRYGPCGSSSPPRARRV